MKKLKINLDDLQVESFETQPDGRSTVEAYSGDVTVYDDNCCGTNDVSCNAATYGGGNTCDTTCDQFICTGGCSGLTVCDATCPGYWDATPTGC
jgi:hypothetical protein